MARYNRLYILWLLLAGLSGYAVVWAAGRLSAGDIAAWPWLLGGLLAFAVSMLSTIYYRGRRHTQSLTEKEQQAVKLAEIKEKR